jgi:hypothetical protein
VLAGVVLPVQVLRDKAKIKPRIATPADVVAGKVLGKAPRGASRYFGWDRAWPVYNPHQAQRDAVAVLGQTRWVTGLAFGWLGDLGPWMAVALPAVVGFALGAWLSILVWSLVMGLLGGFAYLLQQVGVLAYWGYDRLSRRQRKATLRCAKCYRITVIPSYQCPNSACRTTHHNVMPGPLGIVHRLCGCGTRLPTTVRAAAKHLVTVCPHCLQAVPEGSGTRRVLPLPVIGAVGAGKTQFLSGGIVELELQVARLSGSLTPISPAARTFLTNAKLAVASGQRVAKTEWLNRPEGVPFILTLPGREIELQLMDAAGENFVDWERSQALSYIDTADVLLFFFDSLALPEMRELLQISGKAGTVPVAQGDPGDAYASVVDRLRAEDVRLGKKTLAVILTKVDVLQTLPVSRKLAPTDSDSIRAWLTDNGADGFVRRVDQDFKQVSYFAVDSYGPRNALDSLHPLQVLDWALKVTDHRLSVLPRPAVSEEETNTAKEANTA